jgi:membrane protease subunit (stomatin/prohibitin family)/RNA polymerase subunit RPABC4/transcription elongation factor Spt4
MALIEVIDVTDSTGDNIVLRFPETGDADIKLGAQLVVRESQVAIFYRGGQALDTFPPGRHTLSTANLPLLNRLIRLPFGGETPFKAEVYFVNTKTFINKKWGTKEPIVFRDQVLKVVRLRSFGIMSYKVVEPQLFVNKVVGTEGRYNSDRINDFLRSVVIGRLADLLGENLKTLLDLASLYDELGIAAKARVADDFAKYGLELEDLVINAITPPPEVQAKIDERSGMGLFEESMGGYQQYQMAQAMRDMAQNPGTGGEGAGAGMGMGMGLGMGFMMPQMVAQATPGLQQGGQPPPPGSPGGPPGAAGQPGYPTPGGGYGHQAAGAQAAGAQAAGAQAARAQAAGAHGGQAPQQASARPCSNCRNPVPSGYKFCPACGQPAQSEPTTACIKCQAALPSGSKFCPACGAPQEAPKPSCPKCGNELPGPSSRFCPSCGAQIG